MYAKQGVVESVREKGVLHDVGVVSKNRKGVVVVLCRKSILDGRSTLLRLVEMASTLGRYS